MLLDIYLVERNEHCLFDIVFAVRVDKSLILS